MDKNIVALLPSEEVFDLECSGLKIIQNKKGYMFTTDAVILANMVKATPKDVVVDLGTGSSIIPLIVAAKTKAKTIYGVEIQKRLFNMAKRNVELNNLSHVITLLNHNIIDISSVLGRESVNIVISNPPYLKNELKIEPDNATEIEIAKMEILVNLNDIVKEASKLLKFRGKFYCIVKAERLVDLIYLMRQYDVEPKEILPVQATANKNVDTVLVIGQKKANSGVKVLKPMIIMKEDGSYTEKLYKMYYSHCTKLKGK